jgi:hypothetical protein
MNKIYLFKNLLGGVKVGKFSFGVSFFGISSLGVDDYLYFYLFYSLFNLYQLNLVDFIGFKAIGSFAIFLIRFKALLEEFC